MQSLQEEPLALIEQAVQGLEQAEEVKALMISELQLMHEGGRYG